MHISVEPRNGYAVLHLRGEFDTYYVPALQDEVNGLSESGVNNLVLNLRLVRFINSTALGAMIKFSKQLTAAGGALRISRPSKFCRDIIEKVGLDRVVPVYDSDEEAGASFKAAVVTTGETDKVFEEDQSSVLFSPADRSRVEHFLSEEERSGGQGKNPIHQHSFGDKWSGLGRMAGLDDEGLSFTWEGGRTSLDPFTMAQMLALGTDWKVKFRLPLLQKGYCEAMTTVNEVEERPGGVKVRVAFKEIDEDTLASVRQYAADMSYLKDELKKATE
ncbi:MAG: STAS domain-containing protein [Planctomycetes bacterium]|nr:STAS domain-containing protein [Planctomycetota bacterium]MCB9904251.1 STAS domain-containing protein [Planctomycetota bacterium]